MGHYNGVNYFTISLPTIRDNNPALISPPTSALPSNLIIPSITCDPVYQGISARIEADMNYQSPF
jgi:hypothetical protein